MEEALSRVREELGAEALILSTRQQRQKDGVFGWLARPIVEVTAAVDRDARTGRTDAREAAPNGSWRTLSVTRALVDPLEREVRELRQSVDRMASFCSAEDELRKGLAELQRTLATVRAGAATAVAQATGGALAGGVCERLEERGLDGAHARRLTEAVARERRPAESETRCLRRVLARELDRRLVPPRPDRGPQAALFIGATASGKTTTLAKVAGSEIEAEGASVVVTTDVWRKGGEQQLRSLAGELELPFCVALSPEELEGHLRRFGDRRVLVDTPGRSRNDASALPELLRCREVLGARSWVAQVVSATTKGADLRAQLSHYRELVPDAVVVTHVDESEDLWNVANLLLDEATPPLAWVGTGQRVPEDLLVPDPDEMADRIVGYAA